jgi:hypothetical protein
MIDTSSYVFIADTTAREHLLKALRPDTDTGSLVRLALSLGASIAGGAAISLFDVCQNGKDEREMGSVFWKDIDLWFSDEKTLTAFMVTARLNRGIRTQLSYGGHALDIHCGDGPPLQAITFRTGNPIEIISKFDFVNCAVHGRRILAPQRYARCESYENSDNARRKQRIFPRSGQEVRKQGLLSNG